MGTFANTANVVILEDSSTRTVLKLWYQGGTGEANTLKVNAAALGGACMDLTFNIAQQATISGMYKFVPGEQIVADNTAIIGSVVSFTPAVVGANGTLRVALSDPTIAFTNSSIITGGRLGSVITLNQATRPFYQLQIESVWYSITDKNGEAIAIEFADASGQAGNTAPALFLHGQNYLGKNSNIPTKIPNPHANTDPNIYISTYNFLANSSYMIVLEIGKTAGYGDAVEG